MPKPVKKPVRKLKTPAKSKRPSDPNRAAHSMIAEHMRLADSVEAEIVTGDFEAQYRARMSRLGKKGGKASGAKRMEMPVEQRKAIALLAARARWKKRPKG